MPLELILGAAVGAAAASPTVRRAVRRGVVYGLAGVLVAYDKVSHATHSLVSEARRGSTPTPEEAPAPAAHTNGSESQPAAARITTPT